MSKVIEKLKLSSVPLENDLADALEYWQKFKKQNGKAARLGYEPRDIESKGAKTVISTRVLNASSGFDEVDEQYSYEAIVLRYANEFPNEVVAAAKKRLKKRSYWWVNHKQTFEQEVGGDYIWSPITRSDGNRNHFYDNMQKVRRGDIVFSYANRKIQAVGICFTPVVLAPKPNEFGKVGDVWQDEGWKVEVAFKKLDAPLEPKAHMDKLRKLLPEKYSPIRANGDGNQGAYLASISGKLANALIDLIGSDWSKLSFNDESVSDEDTALGDSESVLEATIKNRTDIGETEKLTLVRARRGQGQYRRNLENFEKQCRVTGVTNPRHLRASHIKPWRTSTDFEKLDGNNGLLLSPHIDHLFDKGFISFHDDGKIIISAECDEDVLASWDIKPSAISISFRSEQLPYLAFHRDNIFKD